MPSDVIRYPEGGGRIIHRSRHVAKCDFCSSPHKFLCDYHVGESLKTCDLKLCAVHAAHFRGLDYCPTHAGDVRREP